MNVVINKQFGGFSISALAVKRIAELKGRPCFFFKRDGFSGPYRPADLASIQKQDWHWSAFDISDLSVLPSQEDWSSKPIEERQASNRIWDKHILSSRPDNREDEDLVRAVKELGDAANGMCAKLKIVEIPDGTKYEIDDYDGMESIHEVHESWD